MADDSRPPVAIRSLRPYATEDAFLAEERDTLSRTAITLIGAPTRPRGVVIRFELTLNDGTPLVRGEGRVLGYTPSDEHGPSSLTLRFTKLDAKSKALVDRATALRDSKPPPSQADESATPADTEPPPRDEVPADDLAATSMGVVMPATIDAPPPSEEAIILSISSGNLPLGDAEEIGAAINFATDAPPAMPAEDGGELPPIATAVAVATSAAVDRSAPDAKRDTLLDRLRSRAKTLTPSQVATILAVPRPSS